MQKMWTFKQIITHSDILNLFGQTGMNVQ